MRKKRSAFRIAGDKPRRVYQTLAVDEFGELAGRKKEAEAKALAAGHHLGGWHRRKNDEYGRWTAFCADCNRGAVVCTELPPQTPLDIYGPALTHRCQPSEPFGADAQLPE